MTPIVPDFQKRAARLLAADEPPDLAVLDSLITDGCAEALTLQAELRRVGRKRDDGLRLAAEDPSMAPAVVEAEHRRLDLEESLSAVQEAVSALRARRSRVRLHDVLTDR
jgi:hypothetical protein